MVRNYKPTGKPRGRPRKDGKAPSKTSGKASSAGEAPVKAARQMSVIGKIMFPPPEYLAECFQRQGETLVWKVRPESHFRNAKKANAMDLFNERVAGRVAGNGPKKKHVAIEGKAFRIADIIRVMKEAGL